MAATVSISCPDCGKQLKAPTDILGKKVRCKGCGTIFRAEEDLDDVDAVEEVEEERPRKKAPPKKAPATKAEPKKPEAKKPAPKKSAAGEDDNPYGLTDFEEGNRCPHCAAEMFDDKARICVECGYDTLLRVHNKTKMVVEPTGLEVFLWLLPGILCALACVLIITWIIIHWFFLDDWVDKEVWYWAMLTHLSCKIWTTVPLLFNLAAAGFFAFRRLVLNNMPPEVEIKPTK